MSQEVEGRCWIMWGSVLAGLAVVCGAFAAHGLNDYLAKKYAGVEKIVLGESVPGARKYLGDFKTGAEYQMYHGLGLISLGITWPRLRSRAARVAGNCLLWGTVLFSGSLYALVLTGFTWLGAVTPFGGTLFIVGWGAFAWSARRT